MAPVFDARVPTLLDGLVGQAPPAPAARLIALRGRLLDVSARTYLVLRVVASVTGLWITRHGLMSAHPAGADVYGHVARTDFALDQLFTHGRVDGWYPGLGSGYRLFMVNGPGLALLSAFVQGLSLGSVTTARSFALLGALSIAVLPWAVGLLARELGASRLAAGLHGVLALFVSFYAGGGLSGLYGPGLIAQTIALPLQVLALALVLRALRIGGPSTIGRAALAVAGLALLHPISILILALFVPLGASRHWLVTARRIPRALAVGAWSTALAGFWLVPALSDRDLAGAATTWTTPTLPTRLGEVARGDVLVPQAVALTAAAAIVITVVAAVRHPALRRRLPHVAGALAFLTTAHLAYGHQVGPYDLIVHFPTRGLAPAAFLALLPLAELLADAVHLLRRRMHGPASADLAAVAVAGLLALAIPWQLTGPLDPLDPRQEAIPPAPSLAASAAVLHREVPPMGRHLLVTPPPTALVGTDMPARWLAVMSGTNSAHLYFWEATQENAAGVLAAELAVTVDPADAVATLRRLGVTHVVTTDFGQEQAFAATGAFDLVWRDETVAIRALRPSPGRPSPTALLQPAADVPSETGLAASPTLQQAEHLTWDVDAPRAMPAVAAVAYDPHWRASVDGEAVPLWRSSEGLVEVHLPAGPHTLDLHYTGGRLDPLGVVLTLTGLAGLVGVAVDRHLRRRDMSHPLAGRGISRT